MPYLPLPPAQPPAIAQTLSPEETSSTFSPVASASAKSDRVSSVVQPIAAAPASSATVGSPASTAFSSPSTLVQASPKPNYQKRSSSREALNITLQQASFPLPASDQLGVASGLSSGKTTGAVAAQRASPARLPKSREVSSSFFRKDRAPQTSKVVSSTSKAETVSNLSTNPERFEQISAIQISQFTPSLWELTPSHAASSQVSNDGGTKKLLKFHADSPEYRSIRQALLTVGNALVSSGLGSEIGLEASGPASDLESVNDDPMNRSDIKAPSLAGLLEPRAQTSPVPDDTGGDGLQPLFSQRRVPTQENRDGEPLELYADRQEYDDVRRIFTAAGNVLLRFRGATLRANQLQVNLQTQVATAEGNISFTRGEQKLQGDRLEYNYAQNQGSFLNARGEIYLPTASTDISATAPTGERTGFPTDDDETGTDDIDPDGQPLSEQIRENQPRQVRTTENIQRLRFEAERIEFNARGWEAQDIRITNDPFSPPELEVRADEARLVRVSSLEDRGEATRPRLVFNRGLSLPILRSRVVFDRRERDPAIAQIGFDESERGGLFIGRTFEPLLTDQTSLTITPQFFLQRAVENSNFNIVDPDLYGLKVRLNSTLSPLTSLTGSVILTSFDPTDIGDNLRANLSLRRSVETPIGTHRLTLGYTYRDRVYNGSLGFQDIQNSLGAVLTSPTISLGNTGIDLNYQVGTQYITAETGQFGGLPDPASLGRFQASASLRRGFYLWQGQALPATATAGLRYTPEPIVPYLQLFTGLTGIANAYTSGDTQETLLGRVGLEGQFGHFSRPFLDYTGFNISYSQIGLLGLSPFLFDRVTDFKVLSAGIVQQIYGPIRAGVQISLSLDTGEAFDTEYILEYNRRTYAVFLRYNPSRQIGSVNFRLSGFNWTGGTAPFSGPEVLP